MDRRRFLVSGAGVTAAAIGLPAIGVAATDEELAYANFGVSAELLAKDFYERALGGRPVVARARAFRRGRSAATHHARALSELLAGAGESAPVEKDFEFAWPQGAFTGAAATTRTGLTVLRPVLGAYQGAVLSVSVPSFRVLYASLAASVAEQIGALAGSIGAESFPAALDLETASVALEGYLG